LLEEHRKTFLELGVDAEAAGETTLRISSLPADVKDSEAEGFIGDILTMLGELKNIAPQDLRRKVLYFTACHGAIKAGEIMNMRQMKNLILDLFNTEHPFTCPHGRPCMVQITSEELYKMFKRT
jgi:DNA mismatch repair protein MutL